MFAAGNPSFLVWCPQALVLQGFVLRMGLQHDLRALLLTCLSSNALPASQNALTSLFYLLYLSSSSTYFLNPLLILTLFKYSSHTI